MMKRWRFILVALFGVILLAGIGLAEEPGQQAEGEGEERHYLDCDDSCNGCYSAGACDNKQVGDACGTGRVCRAVEQCVGSACCGCVVEGDDFLAFDYDPENFCRYADVPDNLQVQFMMKNTDLTEPLSIGVPDTGAKGERDGPICYASCTGISSLTGDRSVCGWGQTDKGCSYAEGGARGACIRFGWKSPYVCSSWY